MKYKASLDILSKIMTLAIFILFIWFSVKSIMTFLNPPANGDIILDQAVGPVILGLTFLISTRSYVLNPTEFRIKKLLFTRSIQISDIISVRLISNKDMAGTIRTFASGGVFGYYGKFYNSKLGSMTWYVTQGKNKLLITTRRGEKIIISPDDPGLVEKLQSFLSTDK